MHRTTSTTTGVPPLTTGCVNVTVIFPFPGTATRFVGAPGGSRFGLTVTVVLLATLELKPSPTTRSNVMVFGPWAWVTAGAVNVGFWAVSLESVTVGPLVWVHW